MKIRLHPLEVIGLSLLGPLTLFLLFHFFAPGIGNSTTRDDPDTPGALGRSRTRPVQVFKGKVADLGRIRVFAGLTPGLGFGQPLRETRLRLGLDQESRVYTVLLCNDTDSPFPISGEGWQLSQGDKKTWNRIDVPAPLPHAPLYLSPGSQLPARRVGRLLFAGKSKPAEASLFLSCPEGKASLESVKMPANDLFRF